MKNTLKLNPNHSKKLALATTVAATLLALSACEDPAENSQSVTPPTPDTTTLAGGQLYDHWLDYKTAHNSKYAQPDMTKTKNPMWGSNNPATAKDILDTWRCATCHGWDYQGVNEGVTTISNPVSLLDMKQRYSASELAAFIKNGFYATNPNGDVTVNSPPQIVHAYADILSDSDIEALAQFIKVGTVNIHEYIYAWSGAARGDVANGEAHYTNPNGAGCSSSACHGPAGNIQLIDGTLWLGDVADSEPTEILHKIRFGVSNTRMKSLYEFDPKLTDNDARDILTYLQTLDHAH